MHGSSVQEGADLLIATLLLLICTLVGSHRRRRHEWLRRFEFAVIGRLVVELDWSRPLWGSVPLFAFLCHLTYIITRDQLVLHHRINSDIGQPSLQRKLPAALPPPRSHRLFPSLSKCRRRRGLLRRHPCPGQKTSYSYILLDRLSRPASPPTAVGAAPTTASRAQHHRRGRTTTARSTNG